MKQSIRAAIKAKQSSAYRSITRTPSAMHALDQLKSWSIGNRGVSAAQLDIAAERKMNGGWSRSKNPICQICYIQKALNGCCGCSE